MIRVLAGDCRDVLKTLEPGSFDCALVDPPYGETSLRWDSWVEGWAPLILPILKPHGSMWVFGSLRMFMEHVAEFDGWRLSHDVIWEKHNGAGFFNDRFRRVHETAAHFYPAAARWSSIFKQPQYTNDATARTVRMKAKAAHWTGARAATIYRSEDGGPRLARSVQYVRSEHGRAEHPTQKPIAFVEQLIRYACPISGNVIDPFAGSGTTGIVAKRFGFDCTLIEARGDYADIARDRIRDDAPLFVETALNQAPDFPSQRPLAEAARP